MLGQGYIEPERVVANVSTLFSYKASWQSFLGLSRHARRLVHLPAGTILHTTSTWIHLCPTSAHAGGDGRLASLNAREQPRFVVTVWSPQSPRKFYNLLQYLLIWLVLLELNIQFPGPGCLIIGPCHAYFLQLVRQCRLYLHTYIFPGVLHMARLDSRENKIVRNLSSSPETSR